MILDAEKFYRDFISLSSDKYFNEYQDNSIWTSRVIKLIGQLIKSYGQEAQTEYYRIDVTGWVSHWEKIAAEAKEVRLNPHLWDLKTAVEHENDNKDWTDELVKLAHVRCPLKVVIGYTPCDCREKGGLEDKRIVFAAKLLNLVEAFNENDDEQYLLILGNSAPKSSSSPTYTDYGYRGYLYDHKVRAFLPIEKQA